MIDDADELPIPTQDHLIDDVPKVLFAVFQTGNRANGGVESISQVIDSIGRECVVVTQMDTSSNQRWQQAGHKVEVLSLNYRIGDGFNKSSLTTKLKRIWSLAKTNWQTWRMIRNHKIQVLHCNDPAPFWHVVPAAWITRTPVVLNLRDSKSQNEVTSVAKYRRKFRFSSVILVLSQEMAKFYRDMVGEKFVNDHRMRFKHIYSIVDFERMQLKNLSQRQADRRSLEIAEDAIAIGFVAAFNDKKNQLDFIQQALPELKRQQPNAHIFFVGDFRPSEDPYAQRCQDAVMKLGLKGQITFAGFTDEIEKWYSSLDLVVVPTRKEGMARCMIEALACGTPVVSFDVCSAHEILTHYECGIVIPQGDYLELVNSLVALSGDDAQREELGKNGHTIANKLYSRRKNLRQYQDLYRSLV